MTNLDNMPRSIGADYSVWNADSEITLTNVPWDANYRDIVKFKSQTALNTYIDSLTTASTRIKNATYARADHPVNLPIPMTEAYGFNYIRVYNPAQSPVGNPPMYYYYFINGIENVNPGTTRFTLQLDIWQTFGQGVTWGQCYIERGHIGIANANAFNNYGRDYLTLAEGLDTGAELRIIQNYSIQVMGPNNGNIMVVCNTSLTSDPGDESNPSLQGASGSHILGTPSGASVYFFKSSADFEQFIVDYKEYPWVTQGIMSITAVPDMDTIGYALNQVSIAKSTARCFQIGENQYGRGQYTNLFTKWRTNSQITSAIPSRYALLKKFFTFPYMAIELTAFNGAPVVLKPEQWQNDNGDIAIKTNVVPGGQRIVAYPREYNGYVGGDVVNTNPDGTKEYYLDGGEYLEMSTHVGDLPQFAILNNAGILAIANQAHGLAQQYKTSDWSQQKALQGNSVGYDQANANIGNTQEQGRISRNANIAQVGVANSQAVARGAMGAAQSGIGGAQAGAAAGPAGAAAGAASGIVSSGVDTALDMVQRNANLGISNSAAVASQLSNTNTAQYMRDTNKSLADWSARGDYATSIAQINAKVQDTAMTAPFTSGQAGGESFNYVFGGINLVARFKMIQPADMRAIGEYWLRYGYAVRQFAQLPTSLMVMSNFTYWKLSETYITSSRIPEVFKQAIRGIFEKGVTVWADPAKIGVIDRADNVPLTGVTL